MYTRILIQSNSRIRRSSVRINLLVHVQNTRTEYIIMYSYTVVHSAVGSCGACGQGRSVIQVVGEAPVLEAIARKNLRKHSYTKTDCFSVINILFYINFLLKIKINLTHNFNLKILSKFKFLN